MKVLLSFFFNRNDFKFTIEFFIELIIILVQIPFGNDCYNNSFLRPTIIQYSCDSLDFVCFFDFYNTLDLIGLSSAKVGFLCNLIKHQSIPEVIVLSNLLTFTFDTVLIFVRGKFMLVTLGTLRVKQF